MPSVFIERYIAAKAPEDRRDVIPLVQVSLDPSISIRRVVGSYRNLLEWFDHRTRSLRVENDFDFVGELNRTERLEAHWDYLNEQLKRLGGVDRAAFSFLPVKLELELKDLEDGIEHVEPLDDAAMTAEVKRLLDTDAYKEFVGLDGKKYSFSDDEKQLIIERAEAFFELMEKELVKAILPVLADAKRDLGVEALRAVSEDDVVAQLERRIIDVAETVIMKKDPSRRRRGTLNKAHLVVVEFYYDVPTRRAAAKMLANDAGSFSQWCSDARTTLNKRLDAEVNDALNINQLKEFTTSQLSRPLRQWYLEQQEVLKLLPKSNGSSSKQEQTNSSAQP